MKLLFGLLSGKSEFRNDKMLCLLNIHWPPKLYVAFGCWKVVTVLSFGIGCVLGFVDRNSNTRRMVGMCFVGFSHLSYSSDSGNLVQILGASELFVSTSKMNPPWVDTVS